MSENIKNITVLNDRVLVKAIPNETMSKGGIIMPDSAQKKSTTGTVVAIGDGYLTEKGDRRPLSVKVGNTVMFTEWSGTEVKIDDTKYTVIKEGEILVILDGKKA